MTAIERFVAFMAAPEDLPVRVPNMTDMRLAADCIAFVRDVDAEINMVRDDELVNRCADLVDRIKGASEAVDVPA